MELERAIGEAVARRLETELGDRGLLLDADELAAAEVEAAQRGARLLAGVVRLCYPASDEPAVEFDSERNAARIAAALAFGSATARVLAPGGEPAEPVELLCAMFSLGIGLVDSLCDNAPETGAALLRLVEAQDLADAADEPRARGWLRATVPPALAADPTVAFTVEIIEAFYEALNASYPADLRRRAGAQLCAALEAERRSVARSAAETPREQLLESSRLTSVLPFEIVETLAGGDRGAGTQLGEAMWRIDDLVDLCQDARSGALNGVLLEAGSLERLLDSADISDAAREAAESLRAGLTHANVRDAVSFLCFVQHYAGIAPRPTS